MTDLRDPIYNDENAARAHLEALRWPNGPICPHCGVIGEATALKGKSTRPGVYKCRGCQKPFSVTVGTLFERSHIPLSKWLLATELLCSSKKGMSAHQLHRMLGVTYKSAWFMAHRIRESMREGNIPTPMGGEGHTVEVDETYWGTKKKVRKAKAGFQHKEKIVTLVERGGRARSFHVQRVNSGTLRKVLHEQVLKSTNIMTDDAAYYRHIGTDFASHQVVKHSADEYVRGDVHTNSIEGFFSIFKRGMTGVYQHCSSQHLKRYLAEFDFRYSNRIALGVDDAERAKRALKKIGGRRLTYRRTDLGSYLGA